MPSPSKVKPTAPGAKPPAKAPENPKDRASKPGQGGKPRPPRKPTVTRLAPSTLPLEDLYRNTQETDTYQSGEPKETRKERSQSLCNPRLKSMNKTNGNIRFLTECADSRDGSVTHEQALLFGQWSAFRHAVEPDLLKKAPEDVLREGRRLLRDADVRVYCDCPDFLYAGWKYWDTQRRNPKGDVVNLGESETRKPNETKFPYKLPGHLCKHLMAIYHKHFA